MNQLTNLLNYKQKNINKCTIYLGNLEIKNKNITIFNKNINNIKHYLNIISTKNYKHNSFNTKIINYNNHYLDTQSNIHFKKTNINHTYINNLLLLTYLETKLPINEFSCKQNYNILEESIIKFIVNNEISILFNNSSIKIDIIVNHNIDNTIKLLNKLLTYFI